MSVIFQLFGAGTSQTAHARTSLRDLTDIITEELDRSQDTGLETFAISRLISIYPHKLLAGDL